MTSKAAPGSVHADMSVKDVAAYLGVTKRTVYTMTTDGRHPRHTNSADHIIRFRRNEVDAAADADRHCALNSSRHVTPKTQRRAVRHRRNKSDESEFASTP